MSNRKLNYGRFVVVTLAIAGACLLGGVGLVSCGGNAETSSSSQESQDDVDAKIAADRASIRNEKDSVTAEEAAKQKAEEAARKVEEEADAKKAAELAEAERKAAEEAAAAAQQAASADALRARLNIGEDYRSSFVHGEKPAAYQKYIVLHDTEGGGDGWSVVNSWDSTGAGVAAHFVVGKDGSIVQCVPLDKIAHHAGFGDAGHNAAFGVEDESRDDKVGTVPIGSWAPDYGMNSYSIGIEMVHIGGEGDYPQAQLDAVDGLIAYIDAYFGNTSTIIDHKAWRSGNSDTSPEFAGYLANYQDHRTHN